MKSKIHNDKYINTYTPSGTNINFKIIINNHTKTLNLDIYSLPGTKQNKIN